LLSKEGELRGQSLVPADCMFFPMQKELGANPLASEVLRRLPNYPGRSEPNPQLPG
jgi:hypothetical protein